MKILATEQWEIVCVIQPDRPHPQPYYVIVIFKDRNGKILGKVLIEVPAIKG